VLYNCSAHVEVEDGNKVAKGNVTECGILNFLMSCNVDVEATLKKKEKDDIVEFTIPFSSSRKRATSAIRNPRLNGEISVFCKGAPEMVIELCDSIIDKDGNEDELTDEMKQDILKNVVKTFAGKSYRTILVAHTNYSNTEWTNIKREANDFSTEEDRETVESGLTLIGIFALQDPLRPGIRDSVELCGKAGVTVRMVTGDNIDTAIAISKEAGIIPESLDGDRCGYTCMTGPKFRVAIGGLVEREVDGKMKDFVVNQEVFDTITAELRVLARSSPEDKYLLVTGLRE